jgi:hypothetical protein
VRAAVRLFAQPNPGQCFSLRLQRSELADRVDRSSLPTAGGIEIVILAPDGAALRRIPSAMESEGTWICTWDGSDAHGRPLPSGAYFAIARRAGRVLAEHRLMLVR